ncbi:HNH endonuclease signature motif containing protein [Candidatus Desulforudis audaxviator]|uniref:HNH endonuclease signature motif containing protein n=1 Tax=Candidatus Desulforudis audaxviator TaxID=471827 RepID=UPI00059FE236|nr:HNH endonuclease signature motif containing protein [Candidatus Desulforudis audaxviator]AZK58940.1 hypothetical protein Daudx_0385 [Candidatus Desulforudis audaxviator]
MIVSKRQLSDEEKRAVMDQHTRQGSLRCFVDGHPIEDPVQAEFHHIKPFSEGGPTSIDNIAPVCREHHRRIRTLSLQEFRDKLKLDRFFQEGHQQADGVRLDDVLAYVLGEGGYGKINVVWSELATKLQCTGTMPRPKQFFSTSVR